MISKFFELGAKLYKWNRKRNIEQVHTEMYYADKVWEAIKESDYGDATWFVMTPANYGFLKNTHGTFLDKEEMSAVMSRRLSLMVENGYSIGLHIHFWQCKKMPRDMKIDLLREATEWGEKNGASFSEVVLGWFNFEKGLKEVMNRFNLEIVESGHFIHDYELVR